jgi:hypothetical protein
MNTKAFGARVFDIAVLHRRQGIAGPRRALHGGCLTLSGGTIGESPGNMKFRDDAAAISPFSNPTSPTGAPWKFALEAGPVRFGAAPYSRRAEILTDADI